MGGKLFDLPRMARADYVEREAEVRRYLDEVIPGEYRIPRYYDSKADFGDMDVLVASRQDWAELRERFVRDLGISQVKRTGHVYSTVYRGLQTDFFTVPVAYLDAQYDFMSFNDVGNFIGRICRRFELKWGERGLAYVYRRADGNYKADLELTRDFARVCAFLGLDHAAWCAGFASLEAVFEWVIASPYFSVAPYLDVQGDLAHRLQVRPTVQRFVSYLRERGVSRRFAFADRSAYLSQVIAAFPEADLASKIDRERAAEKLAAAAASRFNGKRVMQLVPGLVGEPLGEFIREFRAAHGGFASWIVATPQEEIDLAIVKAAAAPRAGAPAPMLLAIERATIETWPALVTESCHGWRLLATGGTTGRVNAAWPIEWTGDDLDAAIREVEAWYAARGLPSLFKLTDGAVAPAELPEALARRGYTAATPTLVMARPLLGSRPAGGDGAPIFDHVPPAFDQVLRDAISEPADLEERRGIVARVRQPAAFALIQLDDRAAAIGMTALADGLAGIYLMRTVPEARRRGLARRLLRALLERAAEFGAASAFLQVEADNAPAVRLYETEGFAVLSSYHYWSRTADRLAR